jgi:hypothetical protein
MKFLVKNLIVMGILACITGASNAQITNGTFTAGLAPWTTGGFGTTAGTGGILNDALSTAGNYYWLDGAAGSVLGISQTFTVVAPTSITITGQYATRVTGTGTNSFVLQILNAGNTVLLQSTYNPTAPGAWTTFTSTTNVTTGNLRLLLVGQGNGFDDDYMVDNISVTAASTSAPEPCTLALLALTGIPSMAMLRRRKQR